MNTVRFLVLAPFLLFVGGCSDDGAGTNSNSTSSSPGQLVALFKQKHSEKDLEGLLALVHWDGVEDNVRKLTRDSLQEDIDHELSEVRFEPQPASTLPLEYTREGVVYRLNLRAIGGLVVRYSPDNKGPVTGTTYKLGVLEDGTHRIALAAPFGK